MAETKLITSLHVVTDSETHYDNIGDIDGGMFNEEWLENHIEKHGVTGLLERLSMMITQVCNTHVKVLNNRSNNDAKDNVA